MGASRTKGAVPPALRPFALKVMNIEHPTSNIEQPMFGIRALQYSMLDVVPLQVSRLCSLALLSVRIFENREDFGLRWQLAGAKRSEDWSVAATPLFDCGQSFQSGVALRFPPQSKIWLRLCRAASVC
jgi:hypothetical protein